ncbi:MAG: glycine--tRNA ligase subunit beta [Anaerolineae bacterium]|nr:glycine--tRNA ligase subunit beta [Anaerolineae bacterium]MDW8099371.1 glycine--tRNA ligase subunit beta [Anaerolineae bacterium]
MSSRSPSFQEIIMRLERFWAAHGCVIWQPYSEKVGAGTMNPATVLRVLGPEPWNVAYVEPSYRPDDGRFAENPNRMQMHTQYQVILKPDPGNPQELYLESLEAIGIDCSRHDIRFVEDNWASPALGAWGLGWEVWLDGLEITQFTYFQQAGGIPLDPVAVEITYGLERIAMFLQGVREVWALSWDGRLTYGEILRPQEIEHCEYAFHVADVERLKQMFLLFEAEARNALQHGLVVPAHDYVLRCSHTFNLLDTRGAIGVTERASYFARMRDLAREVAQAYLEQRQRLEYPLLRGIGKREQAEKQKEAAIEPPLLAVSPSSKADFLLELGSEELPAGDVVAVIEQLPALARRSLDQARLAYDEIIVTATPRRQVLYVKGLASRQADAEQVIKGPPANIAYDAEGKPTRAAEGFARRQGVPVESLQRRQADGGEYVFAVKVEPGRSTPAVLVELLPRLIAELHFDMTMRWDSDGITYPRPLRWITALYGDQVIPFRYARVTSGRVSRGLRIHRSPALTITRAEDYWQVMAKANVIVDRAARRQQIAAQIADLAASVGGLVPDDSALLDEVTDLVEAPFALLGEFEPEYLSLPPEVLIGVMKKHQRCFPVIKRANGSTGQRVAELLLPYFITVANGRPSDPALVARGYADVLRARYADAAYFWRHDQEQPLESYRPRLATLTFQEQLGSMLDKSDRLVRLIEQLAPRMGLDPVLYPLAKRAAYLCKADLVTSMVVEMTSLQGIMGRYYALSSGEPEEVAWAIEEHYLPRFTGDHLPETPIGTLLAVADRLDSLAGLFAVGLAPTGSADPFGLRRAALGLIHILIGHEISFSIREGLRMAAELLPIPASSERLEEAAAFIEGRLRAWLLDEGYRFDVVDAVLAARGDDPLRAYRTVQELAKEVEAPDWSEVLVAYARCKRIVRDLKERHPLQPDRLKEPSAQRLYQAYLTVRDYVTPASRVTELVAALRTLKDPINNFFTDILVMADDLEVRSARLGLVQHVAALPDGIADLSRLQGF